MVKSLGGQGRAAAFGLGTLLGALTMIVGLLWPQVADAAALFFAAITICVVIALAVAFIADRRKHALAAHTSPLAGLEYADIEETAVGELVEVDTPPDPLILSQAIATIAIERQLTPREREVLILLVRGRDVRHISDSLVVSVNTVRTHIQNVYSKLEVHSRQELIDRVEAFAYKTAEEVTPPSSSLSSSRSSEIPV